MSKPENPPAFPSLDFAEESEKGMTLRDYFAAKAVEGCVEKAFSDELLKRFSGDSDAVARAIAAASYQIADAMLSERAKGGA